MKPIGYVYLITNCVTKERYIGKRKGPFSRKYLESSWHIKEQVKLYGAENFEITVITWCDSVEELARTEQACLLVTDAAQDPTYVNVYWNARAHGWTVRMKVMGVEKYFGVFQDKTEAAKVADKAALEIHGSRAHLNFPSFHYESSTKGKDTR